MKLPIIPIVGEAFSQLKSRWRPLLRALIGPASVLAALEIAMGRVRGDLWWTIALSLADFLVYVLYAVSCHRIVLLGPQSLANRWGVYWSGRELRFVGWSVAIGLLASLPALPLLAAMYGVSKAPGIDFVNWVPELPSWAITWIAYAPVLYVASRASLVLPATAIGRRPGLGHSWALSRHNGWRLTIALAIPGLMVSALSQLVWSGLGNPGGIVPAFILALWFCLLGAVEVTVLSVAFRRLSSPPLEGAAA